MNTCQIQQTTKMLKFVPANNSSLKVFLQVGGPLRLLWPCSSPTTNMAENTPRWSQTKLLCSSQNPREEYQKWHAREYNYPFLSTMFFYNLVTTLAQPCILKLSQGCDKVVRTLSQGCHNATLAQIHVYF